MTCRSPHTFLAALAMVGGGWVVPVHQAPAQDRDLLSIHRATAPRMSGFGRTGGRRVYRIQAADVLMRNHVPVPPAPARSGTTILVSIRDYRAWLYRDGRHLATSPICAGRPGKETPKGKFTVINKHRDWTSTIYGSPMPYFLRLNSQGGAIGLHSGRLATRHASNGCVQLPPEKARVFFDAAPVGTPVYIR
jgi:lipoprotein-anchoring transpeptidase ErfK/SrfK